MTGINGDVNPHEKSDLSTADPNAPPPAAPGLTPGITESIGTRGLQSAAFYPGKGGRGGYNSFLARENMSFTSTDSDRNLPSDDVSIINTNTNTVTAATATSAAGIIATASIAHPGSGWAGRCACRLLGRYCSSNTNLIRNRSNTTTIDANTITPSDSDSVLI